MRESRPRVPARQGWEPSDRAPCRLALPYDVRVTWLVARSGGGPVVSPN